MSRLDYSANPQLSSSLSPDLQHLIADKHNIFRLLRDSGLRFFDL